MEKIIGKYLYTKHESTNGATITVENLNTGKKAYLFTEDPKDWEAIYFDKADPINDGWEDKIGNKLKSILED